MEGFDAKPVPEWILELEEKILKTYAQLIAISIQKGKHHRQAADALEKAVDITQCFTLDFLEQLENQNPRGFR